MKVLIVEDSATLRHAMKKLIKNIGHIPLFANSGEEALQMVGTIDFDLVIMDIEMPGLDGFETTSLMREALEGRWVPIIFVTGHTSDESVLAGIEAGGDDYLVKPISKGLLEAKIKAMHRIAKMQHQLTRLNEKLIALSQYDDLTQLLNRNAFSKRANQSLLESRRHTKSCALMMLDVDFFKQYNDCYGHISGDECLQRVAKAIKQGALRNSDIVGRYGGEEFIVMLPQTDQKGAILVAEKIISSVEALSIPHCASTVSDYVTVSIGLDMATAATQASLDALVAAADKNLYLAKEQGRNRLVTNHQDHKTILIISENDSVFEGLISTLQNMGNIITSSHNLECIELATEIIPDVILLDIESPCFKSKEALATLEGIAEAESIPLLIITSDDKADSNGVYIDDITVDFIREKIAQ